MSLDQWLRPPTEKEQESFFGIARDLKLNRFDRKYTRFEMIRFKIANWLHWLANKIHS